MIIILLYRDYRRAFRCYEEVLSLAPPTTFSRALDKQMMVEITTARLRLAICLIVISKDEKADLDRAIELLALAKDSFESLLIEEVMESKLMRLECLFWLSRVYKGLGAVYQSTVKSIAAQAVMIIEAAPSFEKPVDSHTLLMIAEMLYTHAQLLDVSHQSIEYYRRSADLYRSLERREVAYQAYVQAGSQSMSLLAILPYEFVHDSNLASDEVSVEAMEAAYAIWKSAVLVAGDDQSSAEDRSMCFYNAGLCALRFDHDLARRALESAQQQLPHLPSFSSPSLSSAIELDRLMMTIDIAFHLSHANLRLNRKQEAMQEINYACQLIESLATSSPSQPIKDQELLMDRWKQCLSMKIIALASLRQYVEAESGVRKLQRLHQRSKTGMLSNDSTWL
jgi:tetratricopeptide (TPR) repeat protein